MERVRSVEALRAIHKTWSLSEERIAFVPTMGALHEGHLTLIRRGKEIADRVVVSIFVNPTQFGAGEDLDAYPRDEEGDCQKCEEAGADVVFLPEVETLYPPGEETWVVTERLPNALCGKKRPGHFRGVTTVCTKLFHIVEPHVAIFGSKDFQQVQVIRKMVRDLCMNMEIEAVDTVRESDGLARSSRNAYLTSEERRNAPVLYRVLRESQEAVLRGHRSADELIASAKTQIQQAGGRVDYIEIVDSNTLESIQTIAPPSHMVLAAFFGRARLIDNAPLPFD